MAVCCFTKLNQPIGTRKNVIIGENNQIAVHLSETSVEGSVLAGVPFKNIGQRQDRLKRLDNFARTVAASIIYDDELPAGRGRL